MKIKYTGALRDYSGYGEAGRHDVGALVNAGVDVTTQIPVYVSDISDYGKLGDLCVSLQDRELGYRIKILHTTPNVYPKYMEDGVYMIGRAFWETDKVPLDFAINLQQMDEIWTGSKFNEQAMRNAGVTRPIYIIPEAIDTDIEEPLPYILPNKDDFKFYSIFEWTERKNPLALLEAFWLEFESTRGVSLTIKTYQVNFGADKREYISQQIRKLKAKLNLKNYADVYLYRELMDKGQVYRFHSSFDCFVSTHRGEGWGIPQMEAMLLGKPVVSTNLGGIHEYIEHQKSGYLMDCDMISIDNVTYNAQWYTRDQKWGDVSVQRVREALRWVYKNRIKREKMALMGKKLVEDKFKLCVVGKMMKERLQAIQDTL